MTHVDKYLNKIFEQFDGHIAATDIKGDFNSEWTDCYELRCYREVENKYAKDFCKYNCIISSANKAIARLNAAKSKCTAATNPNICVKTLQTAVKSFQNKLVRARKAQEASNARLAAFRAKTTGA